MGDTVRYEVDGGVATIALDHPETRNALSDEVLDDLIAAFERARDDKAVRCVVLTSTHEKVFSSGGNLAGFAAEEPLVHKHFGTDRFPRLFRLVGVFPFIIMALIYRNVPRKKATEMLLLGEQISAQEAERLGFVNRVVAAEEFDGAVREWAS